MKNKKAVMQTWVIGLIITIAAFAVVVLWITGGFSWLTKKSYDAASCETSINLRASYFEKSGILSATGFKVPALKCQTTYTCFGDKDECEDKYNNIDAEDEELIKKEIAGLMYECWNQLGKGEKQFLKLSGETQCVLCSVIDFGATVQNKYKTIDGLNKYLFDKTVPGKDFTYAKFFNNNEQYDDISYDTSKKLALLYAVADKDSTIENWIQKLGAFRTLALFTYAMNIKEDQAASLKITVYSGSEIFEVCKDMKGII